MNIFVVIPKFFSEFVSLESIGDLNLFSLLLFATNFFGKCLNNLFEKTVSKNVLNNNKFFLYFLFALGADPYQNYLMGENIIFNLAKENKFEQIFFVFGMFGYLNDLPDTNSECVVHYLASKGKGEVKYLQILLEKNGYLFIFYLKKFILLFQFFFKKQMSIKLVNTRKLLYIGLAVIPLCQ